MAQAPGNDAIIVMDNLQAGGAAGYDMSPLTNDDIPADDGFRMTLTIRQGQTTFEVALSEDALVEELRTAISSLTNAPSYAQRLVYQGKELNDDTRQLSSFGVKDGSAIFLIISHSAQPSPEPQHSPTTNRAGQKRDNAAEIVVSNSGAGTGYAGAGIVAGSGGIQYVMVLPVTGEQMIVLPPDEEQVARKLSAMSRRNTMIIFFAVLVTMTETIIYWSTITLLLINIPRLCLMYVGFYGSRMYRKPNIFVFILYLGMEGVFFLVTFFRAVILRWILWAITYIVIDICFIAWTIFNIRFYRELSSNREILVARARQITANSAALF